MSSDQRPRKHLLVDTLLADEERPFHSSSISIEELSLEVVDGPHQTKVLPMNRENVLIGRGSWCELCLDHDRHISKQHAELRVTPEGVLVKDLGSRNGISINGVRVVEAYLQPGATLGIGQSKMVLRAGERKRKIELRYYDKSQRLVGQSPLMRKLFAQIERLGPVEFPVLLTGETGVGKTCIAEAIHRQSPRKDGPFVVVNCGAISATLIESLFFGYEKGAFTGADQSHRGYFEQAHGGTLFLDEIGELPLELQPRLLDVLERGRVQRLGSEKEREVDIRVLSATHRKLPDEVKSGSFRKDLFYRLAVVELEVPALRERMEDIPLLLEWLTREMSLPAEVQFTPQAVQLLQRYSWPGNVRQLRNILKRTIAFADVDLEQQETATIQPEDISLPELDEDVERPPSNGAAGHSSQSPLPLSCDSLKELLEETEKHALLNALESHSWNVTAAAASLQITRAWLYKRIKKYDFNNPRSS